VERSASRGGLGPALADKSGRPSFRATSAVGVSRMFTLVTDRSSVGRAEPYAPKVRWLCEADLGRRNVRVGSVFPFRRASAAGTRPKGDNRPVAVSGLAYAERGRLIVTTDEEHLPTNAISQSWPS
jgi:hypothetical protein